MLLKIDIDNIDATHGCEIKTPKVRINQALVKQTSYQLKRILKKKDDSDSVF